MYFFPDERLVHPPAHPPHSLSSAHPHDIPRYTINMPVQFRHSKLDSLSDKEIHAFLSQCIKLWFQSHNSYYKSKGLTSEHKLTQHFVKLESFYDKIQPVLRSIGWMILPFKDFKKDLTLTVKSKKLLSDRIFMADLNRYLDQILRTTFDRLVAEKASSATSASATSAATSSAKVIDTLIDDARAKAIAMADSDDLWK